MLICFFLTSCISEIRDSGTKSQYIPQNISFTAGELNPPFFHANSIWSGVAILDYNNDEMLDIFLTNGLSHPDALYHNNGDGTFVDVAQSVGVASITENGAVVAGDIDNDGDTDLIVSTSCSATTLSENGNFLLDGNIILYINNGEGFFEDHPIDLSIEDEIVLRYCTYSLTLADINQNGFLDLIVSNGVDFDSVVPWSFQESHQGSGTIILYNNQNGNFDKVSNILGTTSSYSVLHLDVNQDSLPDLILGQMGEEIEIYIQNSDGDFFFQPSMSHTGRGLWMGMAVGDFSGNGEWEIFSTNQGLSPLIRGYDNLFDQLPNNDIKIITTVPSISNANIREDILQSLNPFHSIFEFDVEKEQLIPSKTEWFVDRTLSQREQLSFDSDVLLQYEYWEKADHLQLLGWNWGVITLDFNGDGWMDIACNGNFGIAPLSIIADEKNGAGGGCLLMNQEGQGFVDVMEIAGLHNINQQGQFVDGRGIATGDLNNDGFPDLVFANRSFNPSDSNPNMQEVGIPKIWLSEHRNNHFLQISLRGSHSNREGIGSKVIVKGKKQKKEFQYTQWVRMGGGFSSSSTSQLSFGLPAAYFDETDQVSVEVSFPSGIIVVQDNIDLNQHIIISESE